MWVEEGETREGKVDGKDTASRHHINDLKFIPELGDGIPSNIIFIYSVAILAYFCSIDKFTNVNTSENA